MTAEYVWNAPTPLRGCQLPASSGQPGDQEHRRRLLARRGEQTAVTVPASCKLVADA